jgi:hypothetical protein
MHAGSAVQGCRPTVRAGRAEADVRRIAAVAQYAVDTRLVCGCTELFLGRFEKKKKKKQEKTKLVSLDADVF